MDPVVGHPQVLLNVVDALPTLSELSSEVNFEQHHHKGGLLPRLIAVQGDIDEDRGDMMIPLYRHPLDLPLPVLQKFTPMVLMIKDAIEKKLNCVPFNHVLIQLYRDGTDYISEHSDKTLDIDLNSTIVNYSIGATRTMRLKPKIKNTYSQESSSSEIIKIPLPSNSCFVLPLTLNATHTHGIKQDKRPNIDKSDEEIGPRISLTFRRIATFYSLHTRLLIGQGAPTAFDGTDKDEKEEDERERLRHAFSMENKTTGGWEDIYRGGFRVLSV